jgi:hypothetical protein
MQEAGPNKKSKTKFAKMRLLSGDYIFVSANNFCRRIYMRSRGYKRHMTLFGWVMMKRIGDCPKFYKKMFSK